MNKVRILFTFAIILGIMEALYFYPLLPDRIAVHFNASGAADGWGPKLPFFEVFGLIFTMMALLLWGLPLLLRRIPDAMINLPNKDYWLAPVRRKQSLDRIMDQMLFMGAMTLLLLDGVIFLSLKANLLSTPVMQAELMWGLLIVFITINIVWIVSLIRGFQRPAK